MMRIQTDRNWLAGLSYFLILLFLAAVVRDIPNQLDPYMPLKQLITSSTMGDPASFAKAAIEIAEKGWVSSENAWVFNLWPPGFVLLEAVIVKLMGPDAPVLLVLQIMAAVLFSSVLLMLFNQLKIKLNTTLAFVLPLIIFAFPVTRLFLLQPTGISLGESFAIGFFLIGFLFVIKSARGEIFVPAVCSGIFFAMAAYFRSQFEIILLALTFWAVLLPLIGRYIPLAQNFRQSLTVASIKPIMVAIVVAHVAMLPWRLYHLVNQGSPQWVYTSSVTFGNSVMKSDYLENNHGGFVVAGGGNLVCRIDSTTCGNTENAKKLFITTFLNNPVQWYSLKLELISKYWFSSISNWVSVGIAPKIIDFIVNGIILLCLILTTILLFIRSMRAKEQLVPMLWITASLYSAYFLIFTVQQFEVRYFYFPKIIIIFLTIMSLGVFWGKDKIVLNALQHKESSQ